MIHSLLHQCILVWFGWVQNWGYAGVFVLMAMESSVIPVPSEIVMPPAAFWAAQGQMSFWGVVAAGTAGSYLGSAISYWASRTLGAPLIHRYGKYVFLPVDKLKLAETWTQRFGLPGIFVARLLPGVRHLISIPAGVLRMNFISFSAVTLLGAGAWCAVLSYFGQTVIGSNPELLQSPEAMAAVIRAKLIWFVVAAASLAVLYGGVVWFKNRSASAPA